MIHWKPEGRKKQGHPRRTRKYGIYTAMNERLNAVHPDVLFDSQGIRIIQSNTSFLLLKYTYIQGYMFQLHTAIIRLLP
jgi:hypothetical protein